MEQHSQRTNIQRTICTACNEKAETNCGFDIVKLQSSSATVSSFLEFPFYRYESLINFCRLSILNYRELSGTFARLCRVVDTATSDMTEELKKIESELAVLEVNQKNLKLLRNKAHYITNELEIFDTNYIRSN